MKNRRLGLWVVAVSAAALIGCGGDKDKDKGDKDKAPKTQEPTTKDKPPVKPPTTTTTKPPTPPSPSGAGVEVKGFDGFRVPSGGKGGPPPHGGTSMVIYSYMKANEVLFGELKGVMTAGGWKITKESKSPRGSIRLIVEKGDKKLDVRIAGRGPRASIILTKPRAPR